MTSRVALLPITGLTERYPTGTGSPTRRQFVAYAAPWEPLPDDGLPRHPEGTLKLTLPDPP